MHSIQGKTIIVTGAGAGIGFGVARYLGSHGANVIMVEYKAEVLAQAEAALRQEGMSVLGVLADVRNRDDIATVVDRTIEKFGAIDGLINNAYAGVPLTPFEDQTDDQLALVIETGAMGTIRFMQAVFHQMKGRGAGAIVNLTSGTSLTGTEGLMGYVASKGAIMAVTRVAAREWGKHGIRVNAVGPVARTPASDRRRVESPALYNSILSQIPLGRLGDPLVDIAPVLGFLVSDASAYVTGQVFMADGGHYTGPA